MSSTLDTSENEDHDGQEDESGDSDETNTESDHADASRESSSSSEDDAGHRSRRQREKLRRRKRKRDLVLKQKQREEKISQKDKLLVSSPCVTIVLYINVQALLEAEPELSEVHEDLLCPVCLDILHEPFKVDPCGHVFCEPCLRRLGQKNPMNCTCPLCRQKIFFCKHQAVSSFKCWFDLCIHI